MKNAFYLVYSLLFLSFILSCKGKKDLTPDDRISGCADSLIAIVRTNSIYSDSLDWVSIHKEIKMLPPKLVLKSAVVAGCLIKRLRAVGDIHSFYLPKKIVEEMAVKNIATEKPGARYLGDHVGYLFVPGFASSNENVNLQFATNIQNLIKSLDQKHIIHKWVIDLRKNGGGNMYPMLAGLGPILGEGILGYFISRQGLYTSWYYINGKTGEGMGVCLKVENPYLLQKSVSQVAILIGAGTKSSGEITTISFIGRDNCKLFGQPSGGYTTGNAIYKLSDGSSIALASAYETDRNKKRYTSKIYPDFTIEPGNTKEDDCLKVAKAWLMK